MGITEVLNALKISERTLRGWGALGVVGRPEGTRWPSAVIHEGRTAQFLLSQGYSIPRIVGARQDGLSFLELEDGLAPILSEMLEPATFEWLVVFWKERAGRRPEKPATIYLRWSADADTFEVRTAGPGVVRVGSKERPIDRLEVLQAGDPWPEDSKAPRCALRVRGKGP